MAEVVSNITLGQLWLAILGVSAVCSVLSKIIESVVKFFSKAKEPEKEQDRRISELENSVSELKKMLSNDDNRLNDFEESNRLTMVALLSLLKHGIDGNDIEAMKEARSDLERYLINK